MKSLGLALCLVLVSACGGDGQEVAEPEPPPTETADATSSIPVPDAFAQLDGAQDTSPYIQAIVQLMPLCNERGYDLADIAVATRDVLASNGTEVSLLEVLVGIEQSVPPEAAPMDCDEIAAAWAALRMG